MVLPQHPVAPACKALHKLYTALLKYQLFEPQKNLVHEELFANIYNFMWVLQGLQRIQINSLYKAITEEKLQKNCIAWTSSIIGDINSTRRADHNTGSCNRFKMLIVLIGQNLL